MMLRSRSQTVQDLNSGILHDHTNVSVNVLYGELFLADFWTD
jgi:hypothetical protein